MSQHSNLDIKPIMHLEIADLRPRKMSCCKKFALQIQRIQECFSRFMSKLSMMVVQTMRGVLYRLKHAHKPVVAIPFPSLENRPPEIDEKLKKFNHFEFYAPQPYECPALSKDQLNRAKFRLSEIEKELGALQIPVAEFNGEAAIKYQEARELKTLIVTASKHWATRSDFGRAEWKALDRINFELMLEHIQNFTDLVSEGVFADQQAKLQNTHGLNFYEVQIAEILAKGIVYLEGLEGKEIKLPTCTQDGKVEYVNYKIVDVTFGDELPGYILEPTDGKSQPWLLARGTSTLGTLDEHKKELRKASNESFKADVYDPNGLAEDAIIKAMVKPPKIRVGAVDVDGESLTQCFKRWSKNGQKPLLAGHSLGGYLVNDLAVRFYSSVDRAYGFSAPGVSRTLAKRWEHKVQKESKLTGKSIEELSKKAVNLSVEGDMVPAAGSSLMGYQLAIVSDYKRRMTPVEKHGDFNLNKGFELAEIDVVKENRRRARRFAESIRISVGKIFRFIHIRFNPKEVPDWWAKRRQYRRMYDEHKQIKRQEKAYMRAAAGAA